MCTLLKAVFDLIQPIRNLNDWTKNIIFFYDKTIHDNLIKTNLLI